MEHAHSHHHHQPQPSELNRVFITGIVLNSLFVLIEFAAGIYYNSLALLSDAGHNLSDVASLGLSLLAFRLAKSKSTGRFTYGLHKSTILASLANAVLLFIAVGSIGWEAIQRFMHPVETKGIVISVVAAIGIGVNAVSAFFFFRHRDRELNMKGAYLHLLSDALVSVGVVIAGIVIYYTGILWIDPLISLLIMAVILYGTWSLMRESLSLSLDAVPSTVDMEKIKAVIMQSKGIKSIHHIHIWAMSTTKNAMTVHLVVEDGMPDTQLSEIKLHLRHELGHLNIQHATFETESESCHVENC